MATRSFTATARKALLRRGRAILRLRQDYGDDPPTDDDGQPDYLAGLSSAERDELESIHAALERVERGIYGRCESCREDVERERLEKRPSEPLCSECAAEAEREPARVEQGRAAHAAAS